MSLTKFGELDMHATISEYLGLNWILQVSICFILVLAIVAILFKLLYRHEKLAIQIFWSSTALFFLTLCFLYGETLYYTYRTSHEHLFNNKLRLDDSHWLYSMGNNWMLIVCLLYLISSITAAMIAKRGETKSACCFIKPWLFHTYGLFFAFAFTAYLVYMGGHFFADTNYYCGHVLNEVLWSLRAIGWILRAGIWVVFSPFLIFFSSSSIGQIFIAATLILAIGQVSLRVYCHIRQPRNSYC